jgi:tight adherence protein B
VTPEPVGTAAAVCAGLALLLALGAPARLPRVAPDARSWWGPALAGGLVVGVALVSGQWGTHRMVLLLVAAAVSYAVLHQGRRRRRARLAEQRRDRVLTACEGIAADLRAGQPPVRALARAAGDWPELRPVLVAAQVDAEVPEALRELARRPGAGELRAVAAAWRVAHDAGTGLAPPLGQVVASLRARRRTAGLVKAEVAAARATAHVLALLPLVVLAMSAGVGGDPVGFLTGTTPVLGCLVAGLGLTGLGWWWLDRLADGVLEG